MTARGGAWDGSLRILLFAAANSIHMRFWAEGFRRRGHFVHVATMHAPRSGSDYACPVDTIPVSRGVSKSGYLRAVPTLRAIVRRIDPDVTIAYYATSYGLLAALAQVHPLVLATAGSDILRGAFGKPPGRWLRYRAAAHATRAADLVLAWAPHMGEAARSFGADPSRILVLPRGIDLPRWPFRTATPPEPNAVEPLRVVSTRNLKRIYRLDRLIDGASEMTARGQPVVLRIFGEGPHRAALERHATARGFDPREILPGHRPQPEIALALCSAHLYVSLSESDGLSHSLLEAMAAGAYPVVSDHPSNLDWVRHGETGEIVGAEAGVGAALAAALSDPGRRERAASLNRKCVEERGDMQKNLGRLEGALRTLCETARREP